MSLETRLAQWLNRELEKRGWSIRQAAQRGGVSPTAINNVLLGREVRLKTYQALSRAFDEPLPRILEWAGEMPSSPEAVRNEDELLHYWRRLDPRERRTLLVQIRGLAEAEESEPRCGGFPAGNLDAQPHPDCMAAVLKAFRQQRVITEADVWDAIRQISDPDIRNRYADILEDIQAKRQEERAHRKKP